MAKIYLPSRLRVAANNQVWVETHASTVQELVHNLTLTFPEIVPFILQEGKLNHYTRVFVNHKEIRDFNYRIEPEDEIHLIQAMAGG